MRSAPVIFVFSGKAHPADTQGIDMLQEVIRHMLDPRFFGKIFFIEDYNLAVSRLMVQGCDVWLNTPRRPYEACGTSGQKVPVNAGVNLSISDGWWCEGYNGENGWTIGPAVTREYLCGEQSDYDDAGFLYALLEEKIVPLYFERNFEGMPHDWLLTVRQSMQSLIARFSSNRMVREYLNDYYIPAAQRYAELRDKHNALTKRLARWKQDVNARFSSLRIEQIRIEGLKGEELMGTQPMQVQIGVLPGGMKPEELLVQLVAGPGDATVLRHSGRRGYGAHGGEHGGQACVRLRLQSVPERAACLRRASASRHTGAGLAAGDAPGPVGINRISFRTPLEFCRRVECPGACVRHRGTVKSEWRLEDFFGAAIRRFAGKKAFGGAVP